MNQHFAAFFFIHTRFAAGLDNKGKHKINTVNKVFLFDNYFIVLKALKSDYQYTNIGKLITFQLCDKNLLFSI